LVEPLVDAVGLLGALDELFPDMPAEDWRPYRERYPELFHRDEWRLWVMCFLVRAGGSTVVVDTGAGPPGFWEGWEPEREGGLLPALAGHGVQPGDVDVVFLTHVHVDHVGWNAHPDGRPVFKNARYFLHADALAAAGERTDRPHVGHSILGLGDRVETVADGDEIAPRVRVLALPGHDDGHSGLEVGDSALIVGDAIPHPMQLDHPEQTFAFDEDDEQAAETRRRLLRELGDRILYSSHLREGWRR
jgi:glyoxylase-like metal-dependent hydrolase (beta-lactamase superfamily II)